MGLFGGGNSSSNTSNYNIGTGTTQDNNQGAIAYGGNVRYEQTTTDHGAVAGGVALGQAALLANSSALKDAVGLGNNALIANNSAVRAALDSSGAMAKDAFNFGAKSLDFGSYALDSNKAIAGNAMDKNAALAGTAMDTTNKALKSVADSAGDVVGKIAGFASEILANGQRATSEALGFAKNMSQSESANQSELMVKAITVLGIVAVLGFALTRGKK